MLETLKAAPVVSNPSCLELTETAIKKDNLRDWIHFHYSKNSFGKANTKNEKELKSHGSRTSFWPTARRASARRAALILRLKFNGRPFRPPTKWRSKNQIVLSWSIFTTKLELILPKIAEKIQSLRPAAVPQSGTASQKNCLSLLN